jgi:hypothetical protein
VPLKTKINEINTLKNAFFKKKNRITITITQFCNQIFPEEILNLQKDIDTEMRRIESLYDNISYNPNYSPKISWKTIDEYLTIKQEYKNSNDIYKTNFARLCTKIKEKIKQEIKNKNQKIQTVDSNKLNTDTEYYTYDFEKKDIKKLGKFVEKIYNTFYEPIATRTGNKYVVEYLFIDNGVETKVSIETDILVMVDPNNDTDANVLNLTNNGIEGLNEGVAPGVASELATGVASELAPGVAQGLATGVASELATGVAPGVAPELAPELAPGSATGGGKPKKTRRKKNKKRSSKRRHKK